jgi:hypothetical protein
MAEPEPVTELSAFSNENAIATEWQQGRGELRDAEVYWFAPLTAFGFGKGTPYSQTRWGFRKSP